MRIPDEIRKCVVFLGYQMANGSYRFAGTALFLGALGEKPYLFLITARHVIEGIQNKGVPVLARVNTKSGGSEWVAINKWYFPQDDPSLDVAISPASLIDMDHKVLEKNVALTPEISQKLEIGVGDEIFITGLFAHYTGELKNVPIVRVGNLATYPEERIRTKDYGEMDAYLIEVRSIRGLSGSPVFVYAEPNRFYRDRFHRHIPSLQTPPQFHLLGLLHGHYVKDMKSGGSGTEDVEALNTGIAIVVPVEKILNLVDAIRGSLTW